MILAGDIGGTSARLALCEKNAEGFEIIAVERFSSGAFLSFEAIIERFLSDKTNAQIERACFGVPGPVTGGIIKLANLPWTVDVTAVKDLLGIKQISFINDLEANAYGLNELTEKDVAVLNAGEPNAAGNAAIISAGTGLGEAGLHFEEEMNKLRPFASEGGHTDFAPRSELEIELLRFLLEKFDHVSWERVVSGKGLQNIYEFLRRTGRAEEPAWLKDEIAASDDLTAVISRNALTGKAVICEQTLDIFVSLYGAEAGNLALKMLATNGVFIGGGIAPKILPKLKEDCFLKSFQAKGRMQSLLEKIPVRVVLNDQTALLGAAHFAFYEIKD